MSDYTIKFDEERIKRAVDEATAEALNAGAQILVRVMKANFGSEGGGVARQQSYRFKRTKDGFAVNKRTGNLIRLKSGKRGRNVYYGAPPGAFPGVRTGTLRNSIAVDPASPGRLYALVGTNLKYGRWLEFGYSLKVKSKDGQKFVPVAARPWALRSMNQASAEVRAAFSRRFDTALRGRLR